MHTKRSVFLTCLTIVTAPHILYCPPKKGKGAAAAAASANTAETPAQHEPFVAAATPQSPRSPLPSPRQQTAAAAVAAAAVALTPPLVAGAGALESLLTDIIDLGNGTKITREEYAARLDESRKADWDDCHEDTKTNGTARVQPMQPDPWWLAVLRLPTAWIEKYIHDDYRTERARYHLGESAAKILCEKTEPEFDLFVEYLNRHSAGEGFHWLDAGLKDAIKNNNIQAFHRLAKAAVPYRLNLPPRTMFDTNELLKKMADSNNAALEETLVQHCEAQHALQATIAQLKGAVPARHAAEAIAAHAKEQAEALTRYGSHNYLPRGRSPSPSSRTAK